MRGRSLDAAEIDRLTHVARALERAVRVNPHERERCETNLVHVVDQLEADDVRLARMLHHLGMTYKKLARLRKAKRDRPPGPPLHQSSPPQIRFDLIDLTEAGDRSVSVAESIQSFDLRSDAHSIASSELSNQAYVSGTTSAGVTIALGLPLPDQDGPERRLSLTQEAKIIQRGLRSRRTHVSPDTTLVDLQDEAIRRPFILHLAAHREFGLTTLAGSDGRRNPVVDEDLAKAIAPAEGAPSAIMLSFCDSHEVAALIEDRDIAVISFQGEVLDEAARAFYWHLYEAIALGRTISLAFEVAAGAVRGAYGLQTAINPFSSTHGRSLPL